ncbi:hypothetical protein SDC9_139018 [bioreactor metagenome]|uniref:Uncharacterized protein n=1 Tax=bioreactor metagenome TaxID=1076179 RepID=A0A645DQZ5_9ZZZZ
MFGRDKQGHRGGQFPFIIPCRSFPGISVIAGGCGYADHFNIFQLGRDNGGTLLFIVRCYDRHDIAALELAGQTVCKALDGHRHGLLGAVQIIKVGILRSRGVGQLGV